MGNGVLQVQWAHDRVQEKRESGSKGQEKKEWRMRMQHEEGRGPRTTLGE